MRPVFLYIFQNYQTFGLGVNVKVRVTIKVRCSVYLLCLFLPSLLYCILIVHYCHITGGGRIRFKI